jgi:hypothetical protein
MIALAPLAIEIVGPIDGPIPEETADLVAALLLGVVDDDQVEGQDR